MINKLILVLIFFSTFAFSNCTNKENAPIEIPEQLNPEGDYIEVSEKQFESSGFETSPLQYHDFPSILQVSGSIHLPQRYKHLVSSNIGGIVSDMNVIEGHWVNKGQKLYTVSTPELIALQQTYLEIKNQVEYMTLEVARQKLLADENISAKKNYEKAKSDLAMLNAQWTGTKKRLELIGVATSKLTEDTFLSALSIVAPISGYLSAIYATNGGYLDLGEASMEISNTNGSHLELNVLEKDLANIKIGQKVTFTTASDPEKTYISKVHLIENSVQDNGFIAVHGDLEHGNAKALSPGMYVNAQIEILSEKRPALPTEAIVRSNDISYILVQDKSDPTRYLKHKVEPGLSKNGYTSFRAIDPISDSSTILIKGSYFLISEE